MSGLAVVALASAMLAGAPPERAAAVTDCSLSHSNVQVSNDPNQAGAVVNYSAPTLTGTCGAVTCSPASGSFLPAWDDTGDL